MFKVLPEEYTAKSKFIVDAKEKNALRNMTRGEESALGKPKDFINPIKRDKSSMGYSTRKTINETSKASAVQKERFGLYGEKIEFGKVRNAPRDLYGKYWNEKIGIRNAERNRMIAKGKPDIATDQSKITNLLDTFKSKNPVSALRTTDAPRINFALYKSNTVKPNIRGTLPKAQNKIQNKITTSMDMFDTKKSLRSMNKDALSKSDQAIVNKIFIKNKERSIMRKEGIQSEGGILIGKDKIPTIRAAPKSKVSAKDFDTPTIKIADINPRQGAPKGYIGKGRLDDIVKSAKATAKPKLGSAIDIKRVMKGKESGIDKLSIKEKKG
jgi:hypothetical protein